MGSSPFRTQLRHLTKTSLKWDRTTRPMAAECVTLSIVLHEETPNPQASITKLQRTRSHGEPGRPVRERQRQFLDTWRTIYITSASRSAQFARDSANSATPDPLFTSLLQAGPPSSRETAPLPPHLTHYLRHFCEPGRPVRERQRQLRHT